MIYLLLLNFTITLTDDDGNTQSFKNGMRENVFKALCGIKWDIYRTF